MKKINASLTKLQKQVLIKKHTEAPFSGKLLQNNKTGEYSCANCGSVIFDSSAKYDSGSGWPSFNKLIDDSSVELTKDLSFGMDRIEVSCYTCGGHLGHVFSTSSKKPQYCINSASLQFKETK